MFRSSRPPKYLQQIRQKGQFFFQLTLKWKTSDFVFSSSRNAMYWLNTWNVHFYNT